MLYLSVCTFFLSSSERETKPNLQKRCTKDRLIRQTSGVTTDTGELRDYMISILDLFNRFLKSVVKNMKLVYKFPDGLLSCGMSNWQKQTT